MNKRNFTLTSALASIMAIASNSQLMATEPAGSPLSENCAKAHESNDSLVTSVPRILCEQEYAGREAFDNILDTADILTGHHTGRQYGEEPASHPRTEKTPSTMPKRRAKSKTQQLHNYAGDHFVGTQKANSHVERLTCKKPNVANSRLTAEDFFGSRPAAQLTAAERILLVNRYVRLLKRIDIRAFLKAIQRGEGGGLLTPVGGLRGKSADCKRRIGSLTTDGHPKEQGLPNRCFLSTRKYGLSTAAGLYQIVYYRNWRHLRVSLGLKDFTARSQAIAALELVRTSAVPRGNVGEGFRALLNNDLDRAIRKGTDPWASSPYSRWSGTNARPLLKYAHQEQARLRSERHTDAES